MITRWITIGSTLGILWSTRAAAQDLPYAKDYFRNPLAIPMQLVANFGELRANHWHMGLDIRTQQRENLPVYAAAGGYISRIKVEPGGFGQAVYINHPNGLTTLYAHLNRFMPALEEWIKARQYEAESWAVELTVPPALFPVAQGDLIAYSGNTGGSQGPHVHFEIRDTRTEKCLNPLLFNFPIPDAVPPALSRLALYDRGRSIYDQTPQLLPLRKTGTTYSLAKGSSLRVGTDCISFAIGAVDYFTGSTNPNGIYSSRLLVDGQLQAEFVLNNIGYDETRYLNAHIDYRYKAAGGPWLQQLSRMPGDVSGVYTATPSDGVIYLADEAPHQVRLEVRDARQNLSVLTFTVQKDLSLPRTPARPGPKWLPEQVNVWETETFEAFSTEHTLYDTATVSFTTSTGGSGLSPQYSFLSATLPAHDSVTVCIRPQATPEQLDRVVIKSVAGSRTVVTKGAWRNGWIWARFRQFGAFQAFTDLVPPSLNAPPSQITAASRIVFTPTDNFNTIRSFRAELDGQWLRFTNDKGRSWIYRVDEKFPKGTHELKVTVEDEAGNITVRTWTITRQ